MRGQGLNDLPRANSNASHHTISGYFSRCPSLRRACARSRPVCGIRDQDDAEARSVPSGFHRRGRIPSRSRRRPRANPCFEKLAPAADRVVVEQKRMGDLLTAPPSSRSTKTSARRVTRAGRRTIARQRDQLAAIFFAQKAALNHARHQNPPNRKTQEFSSGSSMSRGILFLRKRLLDGSRRGSWYREWR